MAPQAQKLRGKGTEDREGLDGGAELDDDDG